MHKNKKILMVCIGNICRSPIAEGVLQKMSDEQGLNWQIDSAAVMPYHIGKKPHHDSIRICHEKGIDISDQRAMLFKPEHLDDYDDIYVMAEDVMNIIKEKVSASSDSLTKLKYFMAIDPSSPSLDLLDPWYSDYDGYKEVYDEIHKRCIILCHQATNS